MEPDDTTAPDHRTTSDSEGDASTQMNASPADVPDRYAALELQRGEVVIYDCENATAWIQSSQARPVTDTT